MSVICLADIKNRDGDKLIQQVKNVRVSSFSSPSSFYVQLIEEDATYTTLETDMQDFYNVACLYFYCQSSETLKIQESREPFLKKMKLKELKPKMNITVRVMNKWRRCVTEDNPRRCKLIDTGLSFNLMPTNEQNGIYETEYRFLTLPPRALLCGLGKIIPTSPNGYQWTVRACRIFKQLTKNRHLRGFFIQKGLLQNTYYIFLSCTSKDGSNIHINTALCAFDTAISDVIGLHHPIWPSDTPSY